MKNYLFLDIDGVLNDHILDYTSKSFTFKKECVEVFNTILELYRPRIVLHSAWRYMILTGAMSPVGFELMMRTHGIRSSIRIVKHTVSDEEIIKKNPTWTLHENGLDIRESQILNCLKETPSIENYVILDDLPLTNLKNFVRIGKKTGLVPDDIPRVAQYLK